MTDVMTQPTTHQGEQRHSVLRAWGAALGFTAVLGGGITGGVLAYNANARHESAYTHQLAREVAAAAMRDGFPAVGNYCSLTACDDSLNVVDNYGTATFTVNLRTQTATGGPETCAVDIQAQAVKDTKGDVVDLHDYTAFDEASEQLLPRVQDFAGFQHDIQVYGFPVQNTYSLAWGQYLAQSRCTLG